MGQPNFFQQLRKTTSAKVSSVFFSSPEQASRCMEQAGENRIIQQAEQYQAAVTVATGAFLARNLPENLGALATYSLSILIGTQAVSAAKGAVAIYYANTESVEAPNSLAN